MTIDKRFVGSLLGLGLLGLAITLVGTGQPAPFGRFQTTLPPSVHKPAIYMGLGLLGLAVGGFSLTIAVSVISFLVQVATRGREAFESLPTIDPLIGGMLLFGVVALALLGGPTLIREDMADGGPPELPYVSDAFGDGETTVHGVVANDEFSQVTLANGSLPDYPDADGDRLPDEWERAQETPGGVPLPGADPTHKDLYVQVNYAAGIEPLNATERRQLRRIFGGMPVENPDGTSGIHIHVLDTPPHGGPVDESIAISNGFDREFLETYYDDPYLGDRDCSHYLVLFGRVTGRYSGWGSVPGYLSVVDGTDRGPRGGYSSRVVTITHELLHNVVGKMGNGRTHVREGWLNGDAGAFSPSMSNVVREELNVRGFSRSPFYEHYLCDSPVGETN